MSDSSWLRHLSDGARRVLLKEKGALESAVSRVEAEIEELDRRKATLLVEVAGLRGALNALDADRKSGRADLDPDAPSAKAVLAEDRAPRLVEEIEGVFRDAGSVPLHYKQVLDGLAARGVTVGGREPSSTVLALLTNARYGDRFARTGRGVYRLVKRKA